MKKLLISLLLFATLFLSATPILTPVKAQNPVRCGLLDENCCIFAGQDPCGNGLICENNKCVDDPNSSITPAERPDYSGSGKGETWYTQSFPSFFVKVFDDSNPTEIFGERYTAAQVQWILYSLISIPFVDIQGLMRCAFTGDVALCGSEIVKLLTLTDSINNAVANNASKNQPLFSKQSLSGIGYTKGVLEKISPIKTVNAQTASGFGYGAMGIVQDWWIAIRNITYGFVVLVALYYSFLIMFRMKISPQTVISIESAIPKLVIAVLLITFSYAIAGFAVDLMYVITGILAYTIGAILPGFDGASIWSLFVGTLGGFGWIIYVVAYIIMAFFAIVLGLISFIFSSLTNLFAGVILGGSIITVLMGLLSTMLPVIGVALLLLILFYIFKTTAALIKAVVGVFLAVIFAPLQILFGLFSQGSGFGPWLRGLIANLAVFPVVLILLILAINFMAQSSWISLTTFGKNSIFMDVWKTLLPGLINFSDRGVWIPPLLGDGWGGLIFMGASLYILFMVPKAAEIAKGIVSGKGIPEGTAIGQATAFAGGMIAEDFGKKLGVVSNPQNVNIPGFVSRIPGLRNLITPENVAGLAGATRNWGIQNRKFHGD